MADHKYTVATPHGDVNLTTANHHSTYKTIEAFLEAHKVAVATALGLTSVAVSTFSLYLTHGRGGPKIK